MIGQRKPSLGNNHFPILLSSLYYSFLVLTYRYDKEKAKKDAQELANKAGNMRQKSTEDIVKGAEDVMHKAGTANEKTAKDAMKGAEEMAHKAGDIAKHAAANNNA